MNAVKDGHKSTLTSGKMVALAAGLTVGATVGYIIYRHVSTSKTSQGSNAEVSKMTLPIEVYRNLSRYQAKFLDMVTQKSGAHVRISLDGGKSDCQNVSFLLQGSKEQVLLARCVLQNLVIDCEPVVEVLEVPQTAFGRIIGRGGEGLKEMTRTTGAKVSCSKERMHIPGAMGTVTIKGTKQEVKKAKEFIIEKVKEDMIVRAKICESSAQRQKRGHTTVGYGPEVTEREAPMGLNNNIHSSDPEKNRLIHANGTTGQPEDLTEELTSTHTDDGEEESVSTNSLSEVSKFEIPSPDLSFQPDEHLEVYVSAYENPNHFWIQILGVRSLQLDKLTEEMNHFYSNSSATDHGVETIVIGDIVAAPYRDHQTWNRARVLSGPDSELVDLYYVDFGDNGELPRDRLRRMRSDFLSLPFQAIECNLAGVKPKGDEWTESALDDFDRLTHCASWRPLLAKLCSYSHSDLSSWPSVKLCDTSDGTEVDIGEELIRLGHAASFQEAVKGKTGGENSGSLQKMLDDVMGASSELSLSCISLSGKWKQFEDWSPEQPLSSSTHYPHILRIPEHHNFSPSSLFPQSFSQSGSSKMIVQSSPTCLHARCSGTPVPAFPLPSFASSLTSSSRISRLPQSNADNVFPDETSESFYSCLTSNEADDTYIFLHPFQSVEYIWQPGDDDREDKMIFYSQQSFLGDSVSCSSSNTVYMDFTESERDREENQRETNVSHQQTITELAKVCQIKPEEEMSREWRQQCGDVHTGLILTDAISVPTKHTEAASISESADDIVEDELL